MPFIIVENDITQVQADVTVCVVKAEGGYRPGDVYLADSEMSKSGRTIRIIEPAWQGVGENVSANLEACYVNSLKLAMEEGCESIAFPLIGVGGSEISGENALKSAVNAFSEFLEHDEMDIYLAVWDRKAVSTSREFDDKLERYINANYIAYNGPGIDFTARNTQAMPMMADCCIPPTPMPAAQPEKAKQKSIRSLFSQGKSKKEKAGSVKASETAESEILSEDQSMLLNEAVVDFEPVKKTRSLEELLKNSEKTFMEMVYYYTDLRGMSDLEVRKRANLDKKTYSKLKCGNTRKPSQTTALAFAIALKLNLDETKDLLARAGLALSPCSRVDVIVKYFIENEVYDIYAVNIALFEHGEQLLGSQTGV